MPSGLTLAVAFGLAACVPPDKVTGLSPAARRGLVEAIAADSNDSAPLDILRDAARQAPGDAAVQQRYGLAAERAALYPEALAALDRAVAAGGATPARLLARGRIALEAGDVPAAAQSYARALEADPGNVEALNGLGVAGDLAHHHEEARAHYHEALRIAPGDWRVRSNLGMSLLMSGQANEAAGVLAGADRDPAAPRRARHDLALALVAAGKREEAIDVLRTDLPAPDATALADSFAAFAHWLANPRGGQPPVP